MLHHRKTWDSQCRKKHNGHVEDKMLIFGEKVHHPNRRWNQLIIHDSIFLFIRDKETLLPNDVSGPRHHPVGSAWWDIFPSSRFNAYKSFTGLALQLNRTQPARICLAMSFTIRYLKHSTPNYYIHGDAWSYLEVLKTETYTSRTGNLGASILVPDAFISVHQTLIRQTSGDVLWSQVSRIRYPSLKQDERLSNMFTCIVNFLWISTR